MLTPQFTTKTGELSETFGIFTFEPLSQSFGESMGNALRRTLLSSLEGTAVVAVKIEGVPHLFSVLKGVKETALELTLNLKQVHFKKGAEGTHKILLNKKGIGKVFAGDLEGDIEVVNKDLYIGEITDVKGKIELEVLVETGRGYVPANEQSQKEFGYIPVDAAFSPVKKVIYTVEEARVGRKSDSDRVILSVWTDGSIAPDEAVKQAASILSAQFAHIFVQVDSQEAKSVMTAEATGVLEMNKKFNDLIIDELNLPSRVVNALLRENIETVADLVKIGEEKLVAYKGLGRKSIDLIKDELKKLGFEWN
ncbi:MAG: DNA-directed RNA polymerase subunit alpha [Candidatus Roizmanbacteria bacterium]|nr:DNA-directed RNA polymerase subunit alpha [Candidatus Roizmanbacteria bacterium]